MMFDFLSHLEELVCATFLSLLLSGINLQENKEKQLFLLLTVQ